MRRLLFFILLICLNHLSFSQTDSLIRGAYFTIGLTGIYNNTSNITDFIKTNYDREIKSYPVGCQLDIFVVLKKFDIGIYGQRGIPKPILMGFYFGREIYRKNNFISFINFDLGVYTYGRVDKIIPQNYVPNDKEIGKTMELEYMSWYFGLSDKIYFIKSTNSDFITGKIIGVDLKAGYMPNGHWDYGYNDDSGFKSRKISGLPYVSNFYASLTLFVGLH